MTSVAVASAPIKFSKLTPVVATPWEKRPLVIVVAWALIVVSSVPNVLVAPTVSIAASPSF